MPRTGDPALVEQVARELRELERRTGIDRTLAIGELILTRFFGSNALAWRERRRNKNNSLRRLASRSDCPLSKSALHEAVGVYVAVLALPRVRTSGHITASHVASVLRLDETAREQILESADKERWSVRELRKNVVAFRRAKGERRGRPSRDAQARTLSAVRSCLRSTSDALERLAQASPLNAESKLELRGLAREASRLSICMLELGEATPDLARVPPNAPTNAGGREAAGSGG
ncbi:MAG TPA: hypothetical protein VFK05_24655 [Polyangiaceae bacterium]|nr:hypothetical protein [Polyangiaceae bacterium]